jgi:hypothetical protein
MAITKLDGSNYYNWIFDVEMVARQVGTWDVIHGEPRPEKAQEIAEWEWKSIDALTMIGLLVAKSELVHIRGCKTAHEMWRSLEGVYTKNSWANCIALRQQLNAITLGAEDTVQAYVSQVSDTTARMRSVGVNFSEEDKVDVLITFDSPRHLEGSRCCWGLAGRGNAVVACRCTGDYIISACHVHRSRRSERSAGRWKWRVWVWE